MESNLPTQIKLVVSYRFRPCEHGGFIFCPLVSHLYKWPWACILAFSTGFCPGDFIDLYAARHFFQDEFFPVFIRVSLIILIIIVISIFISVLFYDISSDGQMYHMESAIQMKAGWNPFKKELPLNLNQAIWLNHYGKGVEDPQARSMHLQTVWRLPSRPISYYWLLHFVLSMSFLLRLNRFTFRKNILFSTAACI